MKSKINIILVCLSLTLLNIHAQKNLAVGTPTRQTAANAKELFAHPPAGYGEVPFYWWLGDTLTREHLTWHLDLLSEKKVSSLQVNYAHSDKGGPFWGLTFPSQPDIFTDEWWELFGWFMNEAKSRGMSVSLSDYTLGVGQGSYIDRALADTPGLTGAELKFDSVVVNGRTDLRVEDNLLSAVAYQHDKSINLLSYITDNKLIWECPGGEWVIGLVYRANKSLSYDPMNPQAGKMYNKYFFQQFEDHFPETSKGGLNFFFSDELDFNLRGFLWNDYFSAEFRKRKGYVVEEYLPGLFMDIGAMTPKIRLDYNDVMVSLSEKNFFQPVYNWHQDRGLIFGCDHGGRGKDVVEFGDYFRTQRWNQAPGCDQPLLGKDIIKNKVAASISHMYERPRVWLEGFYSSGWGTSSEQVLDAIYSNFIMGHNILSLHGLYYSTPGGWWEWAPPCNHFRMPYWNQMGSLLECSERLSFLFSQGKHRADVAILYPVEPVVAGYGEKAVSSAFDIAETLYRQSIDLDFMDYESLARAKVVKNKLEVAGESFGVLVVPHMKAIRHSSLEKIARFKQAGGIVIMVGDLPEVTEKYKSGDKRTAALISQITAPTAKNRVFHVQTSQEVLDIIDTETIRDFSVCSPLQPTDQPYILHRSIGGKEMYAVYGVPLGSTCFFRAKGGVELWDPWTGVTHPLSVKETTSEGTFIDMPLDRKEIQILVFNPATTPQIHQEVSESSTSPIMIHAQLQDDWELELTPVLDNRYGDFHWPATSELMGAYIYAARFTEGYPDDGTNEWVLPSFDDKAWINQSFSYGARFMILDGVAEVPEQELVRNLPNKSPLSPYNRFTWNGSTYVWKPYEYSWRWGVENDYGHQGYHGLKLEMSDNFIRLGDIQIAATEKRRTEKLNDNYYLYTTIEVPSTATYAVSMGEMKPKSIYVNGEKTNSMNGMIRLKQGVNEILLHYPSHGTTYFVIREQGRAPDILSVYDAEKPLKMAFRGDQSIIPFYVFPGIKSNRFRFISAPGLHTLSFRSYGESKVWVNGEACKMIEKKRQTDGLIYYEAMTKTPSSGEAVVAIEVENMPGMSGGSAIDGGILQQCGKGKFSLKDWSHTEGLAAYSGSAWYRKSISLSTAKQGEKVILDLGRVVSTAEVYINGQKAGTRLQGPWTFDITAFIKEGENYFEILVHNTAGNHYLSVPTLYRGSTEAGITGTVSIIRSIN